jgi:hypothetical protein
MQWKGDENARKIVKLGERGLCRRNETNKREPTLHSGGSGSRAFWSRALRRHVFQLNVPNILISGVQCDFDREVSVKGVC